MNNLVSASWLSYREKINDRFPAYYKYLNPPASEDEILHLQTVLGYEIPAEMQTLYRLNNGESREGRGIFYGLQFLSLSEVERNWLSWKEIIEDGLESLNDFCTSYPEGVIQSVYAHEKWIPLMHDGGGNHIGIDLAPDVNGCIGQIINFGRDEDEKCVLAPNLAELLQLLDTKLAENLQVTTELDDDGIEIFSLNNTHLSDALKAIVKSKY
ncbi:SMI1/KNR4 family protein [Aulosira sp. FACHB-615]|uniref:SMI1/KNR4 family protein n=1 Tax=Aulosira sp. FACHB-615 TaxID=2692777 RepID=UPI001688BAF8|nr:SMI1/KNR4 family protein [Aulosira sp. FACHB-615]MBD2489836.1 SMI1/KNR4 family protein [Aulosira sp. FACHB-615]